MPASSFRLLNNDKIVVAYGKFTKKNNQLEKHLIDNAKEYKIKNLAGDNSKLYTGNLSPGCQSCIDGTWACVYINGLCTRRCFFCSQNRARRKERKILLSGISFNNPDDCIDFIKKFNYKGIAFSGGEPLIVFPLLVQFITKLRERFGKKMYVWFYTNGDLITESKLQMLRKAGLNEIRFDLSARKFDFKPIELAKKIIGNVTIETPAVPEEQNKLIDALKKIESLGIERFNLHELLTSKYNRAAYDQRSYTIKKNMGVSESELTGLKILEHTIKKNINVSINFCTKNYKDRYQSAGEFKRFAPYAKKDYESITPTGLIRQIYICPDKKWLSSFMRENTSRNDYHWDREENKLYLSSDIFIKINKPQTTNYDVFINYLPVKLRNYSKTIKKNEDLIKINNNFKIIITRKKSVFEFNLNQSELKKLFIDMFLHKKPLLDTNELIKKNRQQNKSLSMDSYKQLLGNTLAFKRAFNFLEYL